MIPFRAEESRGRRHPEPAHPYRGEFQRDRDRIIHSRAFRRLEHKTQVFTTRYSDHFRSRLTHTIEVAQVARTVATAMGLNADLAEALALVHDIGHPPFGHSGEKCLDEAMAAYGERFEHNLHALHIVEQFEQRYAAFPGLNLTFEVREGILKHSRDYDPQTYPELAEYRLDCRPPLEAQLIDLADEIAYNVADLDDGCEARLLDVALIRREVPLFDQHFRGAESAWPGAIEKLQLNEALKSMLDALAGDLIRHSLEAIRASGAATVEDVRRHPQRLSGFSPEVAARNRELKEFLNRRLYQDPSLTPERERGGAMIAELFQAYMGQPELMPASYRQRSDSQPLHRVVCDYIAGMTDSYVQRCVEALPK
jgi:dGTPase